MACSSTVYTDDVVAARRLSWIYFENSVHNPEKLDACIKNSTSFLPESHILGLAVADLLEMNKQPDVRAVPVEFGCDVMECVVMREPRASYRARVAIDRIVPWGT